MHAKKKKEEKKTQQQQQQQQNKTKSHFESYGRCDFESAHARPEWRQTVPMAHLEGRLGVVLSQRSVQREQDRKVIANV
jgi:hypothetical protein